MKPAFSRGVFIRCALVFAVLAAVVLAGCGGASPGGGAVIGPGGMPPGSAPAGNPGGGPPPSTPSPTGDFVFTTSGGSGIAAFGLNSDGSLAPVTGSPFSATGIQGILGDPLGRYVWAQAGSGAQLTTYVVNSDGTLTPGSSVSSPQMSFAGLMTVDPQGNSVYVRNIFADNVDFNEGVQDYRVGQGGALAFQDFVITFGAQTMVITPDGSGAYIGWGYHLDSELDAYTRAANGTLTFVNSVPAPPDPSNGFSKVITASAIHPQGRYVVAQFGHLTQAQPPDTATPELRVYSIGADKSLTDLGTSLAPAPQAHYALFDPGGTWLLLATDSGITVYQFNAATGALSVGNSVSTAALDRLAFSSSGQYVLASSPASGQVYVFSFSNGGLTPAPGSPHAIAQAGSVGVVHK